MSRSPSSSHAFSAPDMPSVEVKIKGECADEPEELPSSSRQHQADGVYPGAVAAEESRSSDSLRYQEAMRGDQAALERRRYSDTAAGNYKTVQDASLDEQMTEDADNRAHHSSNCHLPLKKRKLAASSSDSPTMESKPDYSSPYSESDYQTKVLEFAIREEKRVEEDKYKFVPWDCLPESRERELERLRCGSEYDSRWPQTVDKCTPADLSTKSPLRSCLERDLSQRRRSYEVYAQEQLSSSPQALVGVGKIDSVGHSSPHVSAEVPDNLTILAEEAARIWEERAHGSSMNAPCPFALLGPQGSQAQQGSQARPQAVADFIPRGRMMMSIAEALENPNQKKLEGSVIVRNDQYQYYNDRSRSSAKVYTNTQYHPGSNKIPEMSFEASQRRNDLVNGKTPQDLAKNPPTVKKEVLVNGSDYRERKPIDMSGKQTRNAGLPYSRNVQKDMKAPVERVSICTNCKSAVCRGQCRVIEGSVGRAQVTPARASCSNCKGQACSGKKCKVAPQSGEVGVHQVEFAKKSVSSSSSEQKKYKKCHYCKNVSCDGTCKSAAKNQASSESKVLKCTHCKSAQCSGSCRTNACRPAVCQYCRKAGCDNSRCLFVSPESRKCDSCKSLSCKGKCKANQNSNQKKSLSQEVHTYPPTKIAKCNYCKSTCFGTCRLAEKNQHRCSVCNSATCKGKCALATCSYCNQKNCAGSCRIHHSVDSILGSTSTAKAATPAVSRRRTRNSQPVEQTKSRTPVQPAPESKRRKKSVSR